MVGNGEVNRTIGGVGEMVVAAFDVIENVAGVLEGPDDSAWFEGRDARAQTGKATRTRRAIGCRRTTGRSSGIGWRYFRKTLR